MFHVTNQQNYQSPQVLFFLNYKVQAEIVHLTFIKVYCAICIFLKIQGNCVSCRLVTLKVTLERAFIYKALTFLYTHIHLFIMKILVR